MTGRRLALAAVALALLVAAALAGATVSLGLFSSTSANPGNLTTAGHMSQVNSAHNEAIMTALDLIPGEGVEGRATVRNVGDARGEFRLAVADLRDLPGPRGGLLSKRLRLQVVDTTRWRRPVYRGPLDGLDVSLGTWSPGETHSYRFRVWFPVWRPRTDNLYQRSAVTVTFEWNAVQAAR